MNNKDNINPSHYKSHPSGIECIDVTRHMTFNIGNVIKYCWRAGLKEDTAMNLKHKHLEDLKKAQWYLNDEIKKLEKEFLVSKPDFKIIITGELEVDNLGWNLPDSSLKTTGVDEDKNITDRVNELGSIVNKAGVCIDTYGKEGDMVNMNTKHWTNVGYLSDCEDTYGKEDKNVVSCMNHIPNIDAK